MDGVEDSFLERNYGSAYGELYKPDSMSFGGGRGNGRDFDMGDFDFGGSSEDTSRSEKPSQGGFDPSSMFGGEMPENFDPSTMFGGGEMPENFEPSTMFGGGGRGEDTEKEDSGRESGRPSIGGGFGGFGMGSSDVKLQILF